MRERQQKGRLSETQVADLRQIIDASVQSCLLQV